MDGYNKILKEIKDHFPDFWLGYIAGVILIAGVENLLFISDDNFLKSVIVLCSIVTWTLYWLLKSRLPKSKNGNDIFLLISADSGQLWDKMNTDLINELDKMFVDRGMTKKFNLVVLNRYHSNKYKKLVEKYSKFNSSAYIENRIFTKSEEKKLEKDWAKFHSKTNGQMYIYGDIKRRESPNDVIVLSIEALAFHTPVSLEAKKDIERNFRESWFHNEKFRQIEEVNGWEIGRKHLYLGIIYLLGSASLISKNFEDAYLFHELLLSEISKVDLKHTYITKIKARLPEVLAFELNMLAINSYFDDNIMNAKKYNLLALQLRQNGYTSNLMKSILFMNDGKFTEAKDVILKLKGNAGSDESWKYSLAFLEMISLNYNQSYTLYRGISDLYIEKNKDRGLEIVDFIERYMLNKSNVNSLYFSLGYVYYKHLANLPMALLNFEQFIKRCKHNTKLSLLIKASKKYIFKIKKGMSIK